MQKYIIIAVFGVVTLILLGGFLAMIESSVAEIVEETGLIGENNKKLYTCRVEISAWSLYETPVFDRSESVCRVEGACFFTGVKFGVRELAFLSEDYLLKVRTAEQGLESVATGTAFVYNQANVNFRVCTEKDFNIDLFKWDKTQTDQIIIKV